MRTRLRVRATLASVAAPVLIAALAGCQSDAPASRPGEPSPAQPYAGLQERNIRALAPERESDLLAGRGAGYALAAELNHYPGPTHVLELGDRIEVSGEQQDAVAAIKAAMQQEAVRLGTQMVNLEEELDRGFRSGAITSEDLESLTSEIASVEGRLRNIHLQAHLRTVEILTDEQVARYDGLRGYTSDEGAISTVTGSHNSHGLQH